MKIYILFYFSSYFFVGILKENVLFSSAEVYVPYIYIYIYYTINLIPLNIYIKFSNLILINKKNVKYSCRYYSIKYIFSLYQYISNCFFRLCIMLYGNQ